MVLGTGRSWLFPGSLEPGASRPGCRGTSPPLLTPHWGCGAPHALSCARSQHWGEGAGRARLGSDWCHHEQGTWWHLPSCAHGLRSLGHPSHSSLVPSPLAALTWRMAPPAGPCWTPRPALARGWSSKAPSPMASAVSPSCTALTATTTCPQKPCPATPPLPATCECPPPRSPGPPVPSLRLTLPLLPQAWRRHDCHSLRTGRCCPLVPSTGVEVLGGSARPQLPLAPPRSWPVSARSGAT